MTDTLCSDCPPVGYPTDETRCAPCPRRTSDDAPCTGCGGTGVTFQTEKRCACQPQEPPSGAPIDFLTGTYDPENFDVSDNDPDYERNKAKTDLDRYADAFTAGHHAVMVAIEKRWELYGYPESVVCDVLGRIASGEDRYRAEDAALGNGDDE